MKKSLMILIAAATLLFSVVACEEKEDSKLKDFTHPEYSSTDSFVLGAIYSLGQHSIQATRNSDIAQAAVNRLYSFIDSLEDRGEINAMNAAVFRAHSYEVIRQETEADDEIGFS